LGDMPNSKHGPANTKGQTGKDLATKAKTDTQQPPSKVREEPPNRA
jgi:hypothetical protein